MTELQAANLLLACFLAAEAVLLLVFYCLLKMAGTKREIDQLKNPSKAVDLDQAND